MRESWVKRVRSTVLLACFFAAVQLNAPLSPAQEPQSKTSQTVPTQDGTSSSETAPVIAVRIVTEDGQVLKEGSANISVKIGKPLDHGEIAASIRSLYKSGDYADVKAVVTPADSGVRLDFVVRPQLFFNQLEIQGLVTPPSEAAAAAAMQISLGQPYRKDVVDEGTQKLRDRLHEEGLYSAKVSITTEEHPATRQLDLIVRVTPGKRARVARVDLKNGTEYSNAEMLSRLRMKVGREITTARIQRGTARIRNFLVKKGHLNARATVRRGDFDAATNSVPLELEVTEGPLVRLAVTGAKFSKGTLKKLVPVYQEGAVDTDLLEEGKRNIRERLESTGYFDAQVDYTTSTEDVENAGGKKRTEEVITYQIERGERHKLIAIEIAGNHYFGTDLLRSRLQVSKGDFSTRARFSRRLLDADRDSMQNLYLSNGFLDAKVEAQTIDNYHGKNGDLLFQFTIREGKQTRVASLAIEGVRAFQKEELLSVIGSTAGQPYSEANVATDRDNILALYFNEGFPDARFTSTAERVKAETTPQVKNENGGTAVGKQANAKAKKPPEIAQAEPVQLRFIIDEGPQTVVRKVLLTGYNHTRAGVVRREVTVKPNEPLREGDVVESQRRLYNLGIFNRVTIEPQNASGTDPNKDIVVLVEEAKRYTIGYGGGFEVQRLASTTNPTGGEVQAAVRGILEISKLNLTGRGDSLSLKLRGSTIEDRVLLGYSEPDTFADPHLSLQATAYTEKTQDINTFTESRYEGSLQLTDQFTPRTSLLYRYTFRKVLVSNLNIPAQEIPLFNAPTLVSEFSLGWVRDTRDNPADASKGTFNSADFSVADTALGSSASFLRFFYQNSTYYPIKRRFSFARSIRLGILEPYRDTVSLSFPAPTSPPLPTVIPLPERFFAGGGTSLRGFALNQAGPRDAITGFPVGGQAMLVLNQEFRFPMKLPYIGTALGGALFYDGGNVYSRLRRITFRPYSPKPVFNPTNPTQCQFNCTNELNYFAHTVGLGFRYATPVGPIRIDLGYQLNRPLFVVPIPCPNNTPSCVAGSLGFKGARLPGFQIFFNLGSTF